MKESNKEWFPIVLALALSVPGFSLLWDQVKNWGDSQSWQLLIISAIVVLAAIFMFFKAIFKILFDRWSSEAGESLHGFFQRLLSRYGSAYKKYALAESRFDDSKGLTTKGTYSLKVNDVFVSLSVHPDSPHSLSSNLVSYTSRSAAMEGVKNQRPARSSRIISRTINFAFDALATSTNKSGVKTGWSVTASSVDAKRKVRRFEKAERAKIEEALRRASIWGWLKFLKEEKGMLAVVGPPGCGKTTLLKHVLLTIAGDASRDFKGAYPFLVYLRDYSKWFESGESEGKDLADMLKVKLSNVRKKEPRGWLEKSLNSGRSIVMFDGLDELPSDENRLRAANWLEKQKAKYESTIFVVTSRPGGYRNSGLEANVLAQVQPLSEEGVREFAERWYEQTFELEMSGDVEAAHIASKAECKKFIQGAYTSNSVSELTVNPLLLKMVVNVHHYKGALPDTRSDLYREICQVLLGRRQESRGVASALSGDKNQLLLEGLAYGMMDRKVRDIDLEGAAKIIGPSLSAVGSEMSVQDFLIQIQESSGLIIEREAGLFSFSHFTFQEYLAAMAIVRRSDSNILVARIGDPWWEEVAVFYSANADASEIIEKCISTAQDDERRSVSCLSLAVACAESSLRLNPDASRLLDSLLRVDDPSDEPSVRLAASVRLFRRRHNFFRISEGRYFDPNPITCVEYQYYLNDNHLYSTRPPVQWNSDFFPCGSDNSPVRGVEPRDAMHFFDWVNKKIDDQWLYGAARGKSDYKFASNEYVKYSFLERRLTSSLQGHLDPKYPVNFPYVATLVASPMEDMNYCAKIGQEDSAYLERLAGSSFSVESVEEGGFYELIGSLRNEGLIYERRTVDTNIPESSYLVPKAIDSYRAQGEAQEAFRDLMDLMESKNLALSEKDSNYMVAVAQGINHTMPIVFVGAPSVRISYDFCEEERRYMRLASSSLSYEIDRLVLRMNSKGEAYRNESFNHLILRKVFTSKVFSWVTSISFDVVPASSSMWESVSNRYWHLRNMLCLVEARLQGMSEAHEGIYLFRSRDSADFLY